MWELLMLKMRKKKNEKKKCSWFDYSESHSNLRITELLTNNPKPGNRLRKYNKRVIMVTVTAINTSYKHERPVWYKKSAFPQIDELLSRDVASAVLLWQLGVLQRWNPVMEKGCRIFCSNMIRRTCALIGRVRCRRQPNEMRCCWCCRVENS